MTNSILVDWRTGRSAGFAPFRMRPYLIQTLPSHRQPALQQQLSLLDREVTRFFQYPEELALARVGDSQGLGGRSSGSN